MWLLMCSKEKMPAIILYGLQSTAPDDDDAAALQLLSPSDATRLANRPGQYPCLARTLEPACHCAAPAGLQPSRGWRLLGTPCA